MLLLFILYKSDNRRVSATVLQINTTVNNQLLYSDRRWNITNLRHNLNAVLVLVNRSLRPLLSVSLNFTAHTRRYSSTDRHRPSRTKTRPNQLPFPTTTIVSGMVSLTSSYEWLIPRKRWLCFSFARTLPTYLNPRLCRGCILNAY